jgi:hypothetical protein
MRALLGNLFPGIVRRYSRVIAQRTQLSVLLIPLIVIVILRRARKRNEL